MCGSMPEVSPAYKNAGQVNPNIMISEYLIYINICDDKYAVYTDNQQWRV